MTSSSTALARAEESGAWWLYSIELVARPEVIVRSAVTEVEGVSGVSTTAGAELAEMIGLKTLPKGVKVQFEEHKILIDVIITVKYGNNVVNVSRAVQQAVRRALQAATGSENAEVNVHVSGLAFDK